MHEPTTLGGRIRYIRRRRGLTQKHVADLAGIGASYLSYIESGRRRVDSKTLIEQLAIALGCSVVDITGEPYLPAHRHTADALHFVPEIQLALADSSWDDVPDQAPRPLADLREPIRLAQHHQMDRARYDLAGVDLAAMITDLHIHALRGTADDRRAALRELVTASGVAFGVTKNLGYPDLAVIAAQRGFEAARRSEDPALMAFAGQRHAQAIQRVGAVRRAGALLDDAIEAAQPQGDPTAADTSAAEGLGLAHLTASMNAAKAGNRPLARDHLNAATELADRVGEGNAQHQHFGKANLGVWRISIGVELGEGVETYDKVFSTINVAQLASADREAMLKADAARALAQEDRGRRDDEAVRLLDAADRAAPSRVRQDPVMRELIGALSRRSKRPSWELKSLRRRFGVG